jgi:hypothetical protein
MDQSWWLTNDEKVALGQGYQLPCFFFGYLDLYLFLFSEICLEYGCMGVVKMLWMACPCM